MGKKRMGRPTDNPKEMQMSIRFDAESTEILERYANQEGVTKAEAVRRGVKKLKDDIKK